MRLDESYFTGYQALASTAVAVAGLSALAFLALALASTFRPLIRPKLKGSLWPVFAGAVFCGVLFSLIRLFDSREWVVFSFGIAFLVLLGAHLAGSFLSGLKSTAVSYTLLVMGLFFLVADLLASSIGNTVYYALPIIIGLIALPCSEALLPSAHERWRPAISALGLLLAGGSAWVMFSTIADDRGTAFDTVNILSGGVIALGLARLAAYGRGPGTDFTSRICNWVLRSQQVMFLLGAVFGLYFALIRPAIVEEISFAPLVEWALVCLAVWYIYRSSRAGMEAHTSDAFFPVWRKYGPQVQRVLDEDFAYISLVQQEFIEGGQKDGLVVYLTTLLNRMGVSRTGIVNLLHPLIGYQDEESPWYPLMRDHTGLARKNQEARRRVVDQVLASLDRAVEEQTKPQRRRYKWRVRL